MQLHTHVLTTLKGHELLFRMVYSNNVLLVAHTFDDLYLSSTHDS